VGRCKPIAQFSNKVRLLRSAVRRAVKRMRHEV